MARGSAAPAAMGWQVPGAEASAQLRQAPWQASAQQTPSTQKPLAHSWAAAQVCPLDFGPQLPLTQLWPLAQSVSAWQWLMHAPATHWNGSQSRTPGDRQAPMPSQVPAVFSRLPLHEEAAQTVSAAYREHPPIPSHTPDCPQLDAGLFSQTWWGSAAPRVAGAQVPSRPDCAQLTQAPVQAMLQQTPSAQKPEAHCEPALQIAPSGLGPQLPFTHFDPTQSLSDAQVTAQAPLFASQLNGAQMTVGPAVQVP
jgi:hypothetical protein